jgi:TRAP-type C4-dicarboxylate transport system substrate-binding protein
MHIITNAGFFNRLNEEHQRIVRESAKEAMIWAWDEYIRSVDIDRQTLKNLGVTVTQLTPEDQALIISAIQPTLNKLFSENDWADALVEKVRNVR